MARHAEDTVRYAELLEKSKDADGVCHRDEAAKLLAEELAKKTERLADYAVARAHQVADGHDRAHQPEVDDGQMTLDIDTYLVTGDSERVRVDRATSLHTRAYIDVQNAAKEKHDYAHGTKMIYTRKLLAIQIQHDCDMWTAQQKLKGES